MSAHLQFGPEWMRKGPGKTSSAMGGATTGSNSNHESSTSPVGQQDGGAGLTSPTSAGSGKVGLGQVHKRTNPSLGNLSAANAGGAAVLGTGGGAPSGPAATSPAATTPLSGGFSFAAAAQGGAMKEATTPTSSSSSVALPYSSEGDSARYSKRLLSLYSTERGGKSAPTAQSEAPTSPNASLKKKPTLASGGVPSDRDTRRSASAAQDSFSAPRSHSPGGEARGLNARTASSSQDKAIRPGLFQRGSAGASNSAAALPILSPTLFQSRERDRHGSGFQGGVLSGVLAPPSSRRRKESELGLDTLRSPRPGREGDSDHQQQHHQQQSGRRQIDNLPSGRSRSVRTSAHESVPAFPDGTSLAGGIGSTPAVTSNGETIETWSRLGGRRERAPGEGPIGPPADHSGGFSKFSGYERRRERQASNMAGHRRSHEGLRIHSRRDDEGGAQSSGDVDLSKHATYVLNSLKLDGDEEDGELLRQQHEALFQQQQQQEQQQQQQHQDKADPAWSPTTQDWFYRDPSGQVQGPFKANLMQEWYKAKYFSDDLLVRRAEDDDFQALGDKLNFIGNDSTPFLTPPSEYVGARREAAPPMFEPAVSAHQGLPSAGAFQPPQPLGHLGWPSNLDVRSHFGAASGNSSPFGTPQGRYAELDNSQRMREQYVEMIRQRELAEHRALQEQQAAQMAAIAMAQAQGRDPASMGLWASNNFGNGEWNQAPRGHQMNGYIPQDDAIHQHWQQQQQQQQQLHQQQQQHLGHEQYEHQQQHTPLPQHHPHNQQHHDSLQHLQQQPQYQQQYAQAEPLEPVWQADGQAQDLEQNRSGVTAERPLAEVDGTDEGETVRQHLAHVEPQEEEEKAQAGAEPQQEHIPEVVAQAQNEPEQNQAVEEEQAAHEEESLEQAWPQSPSAVEFASEPLMTDEQWSKEESPSRGKKSRRDRARQRTDEEAKSDRADKQRNFASGNVKTVSEDQFRSSQGKDSASSGQQAPLSSWLPDTADANGAAPAKTAPWANSQQDGSTAGMSLREIQEAEAKQAESRKANRPKMQLSLSTSGETALPSTMTWGLAGSYSASTPREVSGTATPPPAWNAKQAPKKTLTEIQEEERARAQRAKEAQVLARSKAYADSASKVQTGLPAPAAGNPAGGNWSVVGAGGKAPGAVVARPVKVAAATTSPAVQRTASGASTWSNGGSVPVVSNGPTNRTQMARKASSQAINGSDGSPAPSPEFIRHCKEQLKGLSVKVDDFIEMLLSFPLDPSPDVVDIIAESVYASSSTLDGRRFAADFVAKRKLDAGYGKKGNALATSSFANGPASATPPTRTASDILKSTPASNDGFGGFKVVKTKGAKKRA